MENKWFNRKLYLDGIKQLRLIGWMAAIVLGLEAILTPIGTQIAYKEYEERIVELLRANGNGIEIMPLFLALILVVAPIMTLYLFRFQNNRAASDCYHAMPQTRICQFLSFHAAILTWIVGIVVCSDGLLLFSTLLCSKVSVAAAPLLKASVGVVAGCLFMESVVAIAMSLTGTTFSNLLVATMIWSVPSIIQCVANMFLSDISILPQPEISMSAGLLSFFYEDSYNLSYLWAGALGDNWLIGFVRWSSILYTAGMGIVYLVIAGVCSQYRKSECATHSAANRPMQMIFRLVPSFIVSLIPVWFIWEGRQNILHQTEDFYFFVGVCYLICLLVYMLYELITVRRWKNVWRALPGFLLVFVLDGVFFGCAYANYNRVLHQCMEAEDVTGFEVDILDTLSDGFYKNYSSSWLSYLGTEITLEDDEIESLLASRLKEEITLTEDGKLLSGSSFTDGNAPYYGNKIYTISLLSGNKRLTREFYLSETEWNRIVTLMKEQKAYQETLMTFPELSEVSYLYSDNISGKEELGEVYETLCEEIQEGGLKKWLQVIEEEEEDSSMFELCLWMDETQLGLPISNAYPKSMSLYIKSLLGEAKDEWQASLEEIEALEEKDNLEVSYIAIEASYLRKEGETWQETYSSFNYYYEDARKDALGRLGEVNALLEEMLKNDTYIEEDGVIRLSYHMEYITDSEELSGDFEENTVTCSSGIGSETTFACTKEQAEKLIALLDEMENMQD